MYKTLLSLMRLTVFKYRGFTQLLPMERKVNEIFHEKIRKYDVLVVVAVVGLAALTLLLAES